MTNFDAYAFSRAFVAFDQTTQVRFAAEAVRQAESTQRDNRRNAVLALVFNAFGDAIASWLQSRNETVATDLHRLYRDFDENRLVVELCDGAVDEFVIQAYMLAIQHITWDAVHQNWISESELDSSYYEGDWWFRQVVWESVEEKQALQQFCSEFAEPHRESHTAIFANGAPDRSCNDIWPQQLISISSTDG